MIKRVLTTPAAELPIVVADVKQWLVIEHTDDDPLIVSMIAQATNFVEQYTAQALLTQTYTYYADCFNGNLELDITPIQSVVVNYDDTDNAEQTLPATDYYADLVSYPSILSPINSWPSTYDKPNAIRVFVTAGYTSAALIPEAIKTGILLLIAHLYENRSGVITGTIASEMPLSVKSFLDKCKVIR